MEVEIEEGAKRGKNDQWVSQAPPHALSAGQPLRVLGIALISRVGSAFRVLDLEMSFLA